LRPFIFSVVLKQSLTQGGSDLRSGWQVCSEPPHSITFSAPPTTAVAANRLHRRCIISACAALWRRIKLLCCAIASPKILKAASLGGLCTACCLFLRLSGRPCKSGHLRVRVVNQWRCYE
jgi:hypothetical protein